MDVVVVDSPPAVTVTVSKTATVSYLVACEGGVSGKGSRGAQQQCHSDSQPKGEESVTAETSKTTTAKKGESARKEPGKGKAGKGETVKNKTAKTGAAKGKPVDSVETAAVSGDSVELLPTAMSRVHSPDGSSYRPPVLPGKERVGFEGNGGSLTNGSGGKVAFSAGIVAGGMPGGEEVGIGAVYVDAGVVEGRSGEQNDDRIMEVRNLEKNLNVLLALSLFVGVGAFCCAIQYKLLLS